MNDRVLIDDDVLLDDHRAIPGFERLGALAGDADDKGHLRQFQARLSERLRQADVAPRVARLGLLIGGQRWLVDLAEAGEIVPLPAAITPVPMTRPWFRGLVNLRGNLYGVTDLQRFLGESPTPVSRDARLLAFGAALQINAALIVSRMLGLHDADDWPVAITPVPLTAPWFRGLVNLRGVLFGVSDLDRFAGGEATPLSRDSRLLAFGAALNLNAALLVSRMLGLHDPMGWQVAEDGGEDAQGQVPAHGTASAQAQAPAWAGRTLIDGEGRTWRELSLARLAADERFLCAGR